MVGPDWVDGWIRPTLCVGTSNHPVGFDHMEYLGYTIRSIAEKGGIIKPGFRWSSAPATGGARDTVGYRRPARQCEHDDRSRFTYQSLLQPIGLTTPGSGSI